MVGVAAVRMLADRTGLTQAIPAILARPGFRPIHDRGRVLVDMACAIAAGGVDIEALRAQAEVFGPVASDTTALRALWRRFRPTRTTHHRVRAPRRVVAFLVDVYLY
jgi:hypothetical protein